MAVKTDDNKNFWLIGHNDKRFRQIRRTVFPGDDPLTDREETIGLLCEEIDSLREEVAELKQESNAADRGRTLLDKARLFWMVRAEKAEAAVERLKQDALLGNSAIPIALRRI